MLTVTKIAPQKGNRLKITFDDGTEVTVREDAYIKHPLRKDQELSLDEMRTFLETALHGDCHYKALDYLSRRLHSKGELRKKLIQKEFPIHLCDKILFELEDQGLINDREYACMFIDQRMASGKGFNKVRQELRQRGIDRELLDELQEELSESIRAQEEETIRSLAKRKWCSYKSDIPVLKRREKLYRFLASRGFPSYIISQTIQNITQEDNNNESPFSY